MTRPTDDLPDEFFVAWLAACERLGIDPIDLIRVSFSESNVRAHAHNPHGDASGLIQFMPATLRGLGWTAGDAAFRQLSAVDQVPYVEAYYRSYARHCTSDALCYVATFLPALLPAAAGDRGGPDYVLCASGGPLGWAYAANPVLDRNGDGAITVSDLGRQLEIACKGARYVELCERMRAAQGVVPDPPDTLPDTSAERITGTSEAIREALDPTR